MEFNTYSYNLGLESFEARDYEKTIELMTDAIDENPFMEFLLAYQIRGYSYNNIKKYELAISDLILVEEFIKDDIDIYLSLGYCYKALNNVKKATTNFLNCTYIDKFNFKANNNLFQIYKINDYELINALMYLDRMLSVSPTTELFVEKGKLLDKMDNSVALAFEAYSNAIKNNPYDFRGYQGIAHIYFRAKEYTQSISYFNKCIDCLKIHVFYYYRGICKKNIGDYEGYLEDITVSANLGNKDAVNEINLNEEKFQNQSENLLFFDTETTGLPKNWNAPCTDIDNWPRLVQISWIIYDKIGNLIKEKNYIIKPKGFTIPIESTLIHKITNEIAIIDGTDIETVLIEFENDMKQIKLLVAHNINFDEKILGAEFHRNYHRNPIDKIEKFCTMNSTKNICKISGTYGYKFPKLQELHQYLFNEEFSGAHNSLIDIKYTAKCYWELKKRKLL